MLSRVTYPPWETKMFTIGRVPVLHDVFWQLKIGRHQDDPQALLSYHLWSTPMWMGADFVPPQCQLRPRSEATQLSPPRRTK